MQPTPHSLDSTCLTEMAAFAEQLADAVRPLSRQWFRHELKVDTKADESPVTIADRAIEAELRKRITQHYPRHGILGEEFGTSSTDADFVWSLDPIDGTRSFISGYPLWGTLIAVLYRGTPILGLIDAPALDERWLGISGQAVRLNGVDCHTSTCQHLDQATLYATSPDMFHATEADAFNRLSGAVSMRRFGGDCYCYALLASGHVDLVMEADLQPYDYLALAPIIQGAGGVMTDWSGQPLSMDSDGRVLAAANAQLHEQALAKIATQ